MPGRRAIRCAGPTLQREPMNLEVKRVLQTGGQLPAPDAKSAAEERPEPRGPRIRTLKDDG